MPKFSGGPAGIVKKILRGTSYIAYSGTPTNVAISSVDPTKTVISFNGPDKPGNSNQAPGLVGIKLTTGTNIELTTCSTNSGDPNSIYNWQIVEYY